MLRSRKALQKTVEGQAECINSLKEEIEIKEEAFIIKLKQIQEINNTPTPSKNNWKLRQELINKKIDDIISFYQK